MRISEKRVFPLFPSGWTCDGIGMSSASEIQDLALKLPERSRLKLAGELLRSVNIGITSADLIAEATRRDSEIESGKVRPLEEAEFWRGVKRRG